MTPKPNCRYYASMSDTFIHATAEVESTARIGQNSKIWNYAQICKGSQVGENVIIGRNVYIGAGVQIGPNCKIQNNALLYEPSILEEGVFVGPAVILTNDSYPRAVNSDGTQKGSTDWNIVGVRVRTGASIGAGSVCIAPLEIGEWALIAAGSTVTKDVPSFALVAGVPARRIGWVGKLGLPLISQDGEKFICPKSGISYLQLDDNTLVEVN